jgi:dolichyl-phosphate-mannose--protein O-mannosyl transferase
VIVVVVDKVIVPVFLSVTTVLSRLVIVDTTSWVLVVVTVLEALAVIFVVTAAAGFVIRHEQALLTALGDLLGR